MSRPCGQCICHKARLCGKLSVHVYMRKRRLSLTEKKMEEYAKSLSPDELQAAECMVKSLKQGVADVKNAAAEGRTIGCPAEDLLAELLEEA